eukprot:12809548-Ditylum_brightwellii.AAC.1
MYIFSIKTLITVKDIRIPINILSKTVNGPYMGDTTCILDVMVISRMCESKTYPMILVFKEQGSVASMQDKKVEHSSDQLCARH